MKFRVTGGPSGNAGIEVAGRRYEPGDEVELTQKQAEWMLEQGYLATSNGKPLPVERTVEAEPKPAVIADEGDDA